jgi:hypothetical protein
MIFAIVKQKWEEKKILVHFFIFATSGHVLPVQQGEDSSVSIRFVGILEIFLLPVPTSESFHC